MSNPPEQQLTCPNGHEFVVSDVDDADSVACPECLEPVHVDSAAPKKRGGMGLWAVMQGGGETQANNSDTSDDDGVAEDVVDDGAADAVDEEASTEPDGASDPDHETEDSAQADNEDSEPATDRPKGLWALMGGAQPSATDKDSTDEEAPVETAKGMQLDDGQSNNVPASDNEQEARDSETDVSDDVAERDEEEFDDGEIDDSEIDDEVEHDGWEVDDPDHIEESAAPALSVEPPAPVSRQLEKPTASYVAFSVGATALLLSTLSLSPFSWGRYPATLVGLFALVLGYQALAECKRSKRPKSIQLMPTFGMVLGVLGMFAGPMYLNELGAQMRENALHAQITINIKKINGGLNAYHERHDRFPPGSKHEPDEGGVEIPMHSWMTAILPHMGQDRLVGLIDPGKPFDHDVNFEAMRRIVPAFLVPGVPHHSNHLGFATAHFSGVGGQITTDAGLFNLGIFERNSTTSRDDITDGQSQTMLIGEVAAAHPAWGEPDNWRSIGPGLNKQITGFGNAEGTGAHFLMADGSVKFFPNKTSAEVLQAMSTRDGGDPVQIE
jgi:hypothetical protein